MKVTKRNPLTGKEHTEDLPITQAQLVSWQKGMVAQRAFPNLTADQREFLISGIPPGHFERALALQLDRKLFTQTQTKGWTAEASTLQLPELPESITIGDDLPVFEFFAEIPEADGDGGVAGWKFVAQGDPDHYVMIWND